MRKYKKPVLNVEQFTANEFIAACGDKNTVYKFKCDADSNGWFSEGGSVYQETNGKDGLQVGLINGDKKLGSYHPCNETHEAKTTDEFVKGYLFGFGNTKAQEVIIWKGNDGNNIHCTTNLDMKTWETSKS